MVDKFLQGGTATTIFDQMFMAHYTGTSQHFSQTRVSRTTQQTYRDTLKEIFPDETDVDRIDTLERVFALPNLGDLIDSKLELQPETFKNGRRLRKKTN